MRAPRVLVVDDEVYITELVATALGYEGYEVEIATTGREALARVLERQFDLAVLDVMLPDLAGTEVCERMRGRGDTTAVVFLTARDATEDKVAALMSGGDDYLTKPFRIEELVARVHAVLRRTRGEGLASARLEFADLMLDEDTHEVWRQGTPVDLTATEFNLLHFLMENPRRVLSKAQILEAVWQVDFEGDPNLVETYVSYLRKKIDVFDPPLIQTVRGVGYSLRLPRGRDMAPRAV